jgi:hypothetical protein
MSLGIVEIISLLMGVSGFSVGTNPTSPTPQAALEYAMPDADVIAFADIGAMVPGNYKVLTNLANQPQIKGNPELLRAVKKMVAEVEGPRGLVKSMVGIDLATDVSDVTASLKIIPKRDPEFVVAVHGKFTTATIDKVAGMAGKQSMKVGANAWFDAGDGNAVGVKNGVMLAGSISLIKDRMADAYKAPALTAGTNLGNASEVLAGKPVVAIVVGLSATARKEALAQGEGKPNFLTDLVKRHKVWSFTVHKDGIGWTWVDSGKAGLDSMEQVSQGLVDVLRAAQVAPRGFAKIVLGAVDSYKGTNKQLDELIRRKVDVMKIVETYTGDGQFKADVNKDTKSLKLTVRLTGKSLSEVMPFGGLLPVGMIGWLTVGKEAKSEAMQMPAPTLPPGKSTSPPLPPPGKKQGNAHKHP